MPSRRCAVREDEALAEVSSFALSSATYRGRACSCPASSSSVVSCASLLGLQDVCAGRRRRRVPQDARVGGGGDAAHDGKGVGDDEDAREGCCASTRRWRASGAGARNADSRQWEWGGEHRVAYGGYAAIRRWGCAARGQRRGRRRTSRRGWDGKRREVGRAMRLGSHRAVRSTGSSGRGGWLRQGGWVARLEPRGGLRLAVGIGCWLRATVAVAVAVAADGDDEMGMHRTPIRGWIFLAPDQRRLHELDHFVSSRLGLLRWRWRKYRTPYRLLKPRVAHAFSFSTVFLSTRDASAPTLSEAGGEGERTTVDEDWMAALASIVQRKIPDMVLKSWYEILELLSRIDIGRVRPKHLFLNSTTQLRQETSTFHSNGKFEQLANPPSIQLKSKPMCASDSTRLAQNHRSHARERLYKQRDSLLAAPDSARLAQKQSHFLLKALFPREPPAPRRRCRLRTPREDGFASPTICALLSLLQIFRSMFLPDTRQVLVNAAHSDGPSEGYSRELKLEKLGELDGIYTCGNLESTELEVTESPG
ncbi:hypothetical protein C8R45DRAFT_1149351 [Mycena sanguinolenta]|nr:hypothetical protein C8R45DRAFT_1149351 [Mycena sanguinolenta]